MSTLLWPFLSTTEVLYGGTVMRGIRVYQSGDQLVASIDDGEVTSLGFLLALAKNPKVQEQPVHLPGVRRALLADYRLVSAGFALRVHDSNSRSFELFYDGRKVQMIAVAVSFGSITEIQPWQADQVQQREEEVDAAEEAEANAIERRREVVNPKR